MANRTFKKGQSTFTCRCCNRTTRNTNGEGDLDLCAQCYELAGLENMLSDSPEEAATVKHDATLYFNELISKGITTTTLRNSFSDLYALCFDGEPEAKPAKAKKAAKVATITTAKYTYPANLTAAQRKTFRAKARRAR